MATGSDKRNIVIVGGGIIGCTTAYFLTRHPTFDPTKHTITLLEATKIAGGASGKAGGLLALWAYPASIVPLSFRLHKELATEHSGAERWGYRKVNCGQIECVGRHLPKKNPLNQVDGKDNIMDGDNEPTGVSLQKRSKAAMTKLHSAGVPSDLDWVHEDSLRSYDEMGDADATAQVHPFQFTNAMADLAREKGVDIRIGASVTSINYNSDHTSITSVTYTSQDSSTPTTLPATDMILTTGPWTPHLLPDLPIRSLRAHSVTIRPSRPVSAYALFTEIKLLTGFTGHAALDSPSSTKPVSRLSRTRGTQLVSPEIYARPHNEVYACGEGDTLVPLPPTTGDVEVDEKRCQDIVDHVSAISDELCFGEVTARQACYLPSVAGSSEPVIGGTGVEGLWVATGHSCWGIQNAPATGKVVSEMVFEGGARSARVEGLDPRRYLT